MALTAGRPGAPLTSTTPTHMVRAWKIAPGKGASQWKMCRTNQCILLGWSELGDYSRYPSEKAILRALDRANGGRTRGAGAGAAEMIWQFREEIQTDDVIVANRGYQEAIGIGVVRSGYLPPSSEENPGDCEWLPHARLVDWKVLKPVVMREYFFEQRTVDSLSLDECAELAERYAECHPGLKRKVEKLFSDVTDGPCREAQSVLSPPERVRATVTRIVRDTVVAYRVKWLHDFLCQICGETIELRDGTRYAEAHHIRPLGGEHKGPDAMGNIMCVCPNHHAQLDLGVMRLAFSKLSRVQGHQIAQEHIDYHNQVIYKG